MSIRNMVESLVTEDDAGDAVETGAGEDLAGDGGSGLMAEPDGESEAGDELDDLDGLDGGEDLGGFDDGAAEASSASVDELEHRFEELETEVGSLSSTVNTVRNENEQISASVGEVEENVRKLLDIYEMVTRGVNPFADGVDGEMAGGGMGDGGFGLFVDDGDQEPETLDEDVATADAEGFFEDDIDDEDGAGPAGEGEFDGADAPLEETADEFDEEFSEDFEDDFDEEFGEGEGDGEGTSFEELKEAYESDEPEWDTEDETADADPETTAAGGDGAETAAAGDADAAPADEVSTNGASAGTPTGPAADEAADDGSASGAAGKPYLAALPEGVGAELIVIEWLEFLVGEAGVRETAGALEYYESIDWIDEAVADDLRTYLSGFDGGGPAATLTIDHHTESLEYIGQLNGGAEAIGLGRVAHGGGSDGVQR